MSKVIENRIKKCADTLKRLEQWIIQGNEVYFFGFRIYNFDDIDLTEFKTMKPIEFRQWLDDRCKFHYKISDTMFKQISLNHVLNYNGYWR